MQSEKRNTPPILVVLIALVVLTGCFGLDFSPDGRRVVLTWALSDKVGKEDGGIAILDLARGSPLFLTLEGGGHPRWSPEGTRIAFAGRDGLRVYDVERRSSRLVLTDSGECVAWSPDGTKLATLQEVSRNGVDAVDAVFLSSPKWEVYGRVRIRTLEKGGTRKEGETNVWRMDESVIGSFDALSWCERLRGVAFIDRVDGNAYLAGPGSVRRLTSTGDVIGIRLSRDGGSMRWARRARGPRLPSVFEMKLTDRSVRRLAPEGRLPLSSEQVRGRFETVHSAIFSPSGARVIVHLIGSYEKKDVPDERWVLMDASGKNPKTVLHVPRSKGFWFGNAAWAPDESKFAIYVMRERLELHLFDGEGRRLRVFRSPKLNAN